MLFTNCNFTVVSYNLYFDFYRKIYKGLKKIVYKFWKIRTEKTLGIVEDNVMEVLFLIHYSLAQCFVFFVFGYLFFRMVY